MSHAQSQHRIIAPRRESLRDALSERRPLTAMFSIIPAIPVVEMIGLAGFDCAIVDMEHGPLGIADLMPLMLAADARGAFPIVRVPDATPHMIGAALDVGAAAVLVPQVVSAETARAAVSAARYAPEGTRGVNPWVRAASYGGGTEWLQAENRNAAVMVMIEGKDGLAALDDILGVEGLDAIFLGPVDMAQSMGFPGQPEHEAVVAAIEEAVERAGRRGVGVAVFAPDAAGAARWFARGVSFVAVSEDTVTILGAFTTLRRECRP
ncbi:HpcH/HpaI aldolase/citrate lyase family protein [Sphingopyxis sp. KK2]|uniref:HpcH/HpaI aldolase family protein n=1 Tax=Sphingopyxis sp. KK2 TaxID=1855727 RepID=UPI0009F819D6|nr:aldolase/citrate lyase family protein [Sphingopyxis sp. KK2]